VNRLSRFWQELKRRKVVRRNTVYAATAFVILELLSIIEEPLKLPEWTMLVIIIILSAGFIVSIILSWLFDFTPEGALERTNPQQQSEIEIKPAASSTWKIASYMSFVVIVGLIAYNIVSGRDLAKELSILEKSIAVLPFDNMSDDSEFAHLGDAMTDEIIMQLYNINAFEVRSRTSVMQYKNTEKGSPVIGQELSVNYLLGGSTQRYEDQIRIRVHLTQASTDNQIWGHVFEGEWKDIFDIQIKVAKQVAEELKTVLSHDEVKSIEKEPTNNVEAYNLYLQGRYLWHSFDKDDKDRSIEYYNQALEIDPNFARAYAGLAIIYHQYSDFGYFPNKEVIPLARKAAVKALELNNTLDEAHVVLAWMKATYDFDWTGSERGFIHALKINPNSAFAHLGYSFFLSYVGRHNEAILETQKAVELDPMDVNMRTNLGLHYYYKREYDTAIEEYRKILELSPNSWYARSHLAVALSQKGLYNEAIEEYAKMEYIQIFHWHLGYIYGIAGNRDKALEILNQYLELSKKEFVSPTHIAIIYIGLGEKDNALEWLEKTYEQNEAGLQFIKVDPMFDNLRSDPRFQDILDQMNFPDY
jgi:TolB-like protein/Flp pilus assembly protein TadD